MKTDWFQWEAEGAIVRFRFKAKGVTDYVVDFDIFFVAMSVPGINCHEMRI